MMAQQKKGQLFIPKASLAADDAFEEKRKALLKKLQEAKPVEIGPTGDINPNTNNSNGNNNSNATLPQIPPGKLASIFWYERDPELYRLEIRAMNERFSQFKLDKLSDGRLFWEGDVKPKLIGYNSYHLMLVYDNNHPHNSTFGGSVKCYLIKPQIEEMEKQLDVTLPHILTDSAGRKYLCTSEIENFKASKEHSTSASSCLMWALKWIGCYELYVAGNIKYQDFAGHGNF